jgi:hypothetical protein
MSIINDITLFFSINLPWDWPFFIKKIKIEIVDYDNLYNQHLYNENTSYTKIQKNTNILRT